MKPAAAFDPAVINWILNAFVALYAVVRKPDIALLTFSCDPLKESIN